MSVEIWIRVVAPISIEAMAALADAAPKRACVRHGGTIVLDGEAHNVIEFFTVAEATTEESSVVGEEVQP